MELGELTTTEIEQLPRDLPVVIPVAAVEQHASHLPLSTDSLLLAEVVRRARANCDHQALFLPLMWLGNSHHHLDFQGTLSAEPRVWVDLLGGLVENALTHGFKRILVINGHGGNCVPTNQCLFEKRQQHRTSSDLLLLSATYWTLGQPLPPSTEYVQSEMGHACEWETSMMLRLNSRLVKPYEALDDVAMEQRFEPAERAWITQERSSRGYIGRPASASEEKGEALFSTFAKGLSRLIEKMYQWDGVSW